LPIWADQYTHFLAHTNMGLRMAASRLHLSCPGLAEDSVSHTGHASDTINLPVRTARDFRRPHRPQRHDRSQNSAWFPSPAQAAATRSTCQSDQRVIFVARTGRSDKSPARLTRDFRRPHRPQHDPCRLYLRHGQPRPARHRRPHRPRPLPPYPRHDAPLLRSLAETLCLTQPES
jgi:hypothetical protein